MKNNTKFSDQEIVDRINAYQKHKSFHPLTCVRESSHELEAVTRDGEIILVCPVKGCGYTQKNIPVSTYSYSVENMVKHKEDPANNPLVSDL